MIRHYPHRPPAEPGSLDWRRRVGLLTWQDITEAWAAIRAPRGPRFIPLPEEIATPGLGAASATIRRLSADEQEALLAWIAGGCPC